MPIKKGQHIGGIRTLDDVRDRCYVDEITGCWHWRLCQSDGRPRVVLYREGKGSRDMAGMRATVLLSGVELTTKRAVWRNRKVCQSPDCVNPAHASYGSRHTMQLHLCAHREANARPRSAQQIAQATQRVAKINETIAAQIRASSEPARVLAERHGISRSQVSQIRLLKCWAPKGASVFSEAFRQWHE